MKMAMLDTSRSDGFRLSGGLVFVIIISFFTIVFAANGIMAYLAVESFSGVQTEKPYENGLAFNRDIERAKIQDAQGWRVDEIITRKDSGDVTLTIRVNNSSEEPVSGLTIASIMKSPANSHEDCSITITEQNAGVYFGSTKCGAGQWDLDMRALKDGNIVYHSVNRVILH